MLTLSKKLFLLLALTFASDNAFAADPQAQAGQDANAKAARDQVKAVAVTCAVAAMRAASEGVVKLLQAPQQAAQQAGRAGFHLAYRKIAAYTTSFYCMAVFATRKNGDPEQSNCARMMAERSAMTLLKGMRITACFTAADSILSGQGQKYQQDIKEGAEALKTAILYQKPKFVEMGVDAQFVDQLADSVQKRYFNMATQQFANANNAIAFLTNHPNQVMTAHLQEVEKSELELKVEQDEKKFGETIAKAAGRLEQWLKNNHAQQVQ